MIKYIFQRVLLTVLIGSFIIGIAGIFIPGFYVSSHNDVHIIKNVETTHKKYNPNTECCDNLGRYVKFWYEENGQKYEESEFYHYTNSVDKECKKGYYNVTQKHIYNDFRDVLFGIICSIFLGSLFISLACCMGEMDLNYDYDASDRPKIFKYRLKLFYWFVQFIGYNGETLDEYYNDQYNAIERHQHHYQMRSFKKMYHDYKTFAETYKPNENRITSPYSVSYVDAHY